jgi:threonylcarbamoyladenosine tRNA methylthiotransferase MtaB
MTNKSKAPIPQQKSAAFLSLGCKVNQTETEGLAELFRGAGYAIVEPSEAPLALIINTCAVTSAAEGKSRRLVRRTVRSHPESVVAVMGCFSQLAAENVKSLGAHIVIGTRERRSLLDYVGTALENHSGQGTLSAPKGAVCCVMPYSEEAESVMSHFSEETAVPYYGGEGAVFFEELPRLSREKRARATVKVQDGCSQLCSYCIVPTVRGPSRSRRPESVLAEVRSLLANGYKEIVLTGIHLGCYGRDFGQSLAGLIDRIAAVPGLVRLRLSSLESTEFFDVSADAGSGLLDVLAEHKDVICPHFHIPLQSGSDGVLTRMQRPYSREDYLGVLKEIRRHFPDAAITTDIMAGFPGESGEEAKETLSMIEECAFADVHAFGFSQRPGTLAARMQGQICSGVKAERVKALMEAGRQSRAAYLRNFYGRTMEVLLERVDEKGACGHTRNYIHVVIPPAQCLKIWHSGSLAAVTLTPDLVGVGTQE